MSIISSKNWGEKSLKNKQKKDTLFVKSEGKAATALVKCLELHDFLTALRAENKVTMDRGLASCKHPHTGGWNLGRASPYVCLVALTVTASRSLQ